MVKIDFDHITEFTDRVFVYILSIYYCQDHFEHN